MVPASGIIESMEEKILNEQNNKLEIEMPGEMSEVPEDPEKNKKLVVGVSAGALVLLVVVISVVMTIMMQNQNKPSGDEGGDSGDGGGSSIVIDDDADVVGIDELTAGTVTTTIDGKRVTYKAKYVVDGVTAVVKSGTYTSSSDDEVVFLVINGGTLSLEDGAVVEKTGSTNFDGRGDAYSFYGTNSAVVVVGEESQAGIANTTIKTSVDGANAVVATNGGSVVVSNITISTTGDASRGLHATFGGKITGNGGSITTLGRSCAALATDRGEGTVKVSGMKLSTAGAGSPLIYSTGEIEVSSSTGTATGAQIAVVEGKNSVVLNDCEFSANGIGNRDYVDNAAVMIYQSMSGDAGVGVGAFKATNCTLTVLPESEVYQITPFFFVTNTTATIELNKVTANFDEDGYLILAKGTDEWGKSGQNGGKVTIDAVDLTSSNLNVGVDEISSVNGVEEIE